MSKPVSPSDLSLHGWCKGNIYHPNNLLILTYYLFRNNLLPVHMGFFGLSFTEDTSHTSQKTKLFLFLWFLHFAVWTGAKQGNASDASWNISSLKCKHTKRLFPFVSKDNSFQFVPTAPADRKLKHWNPWQREHGFLSVQDSWPLPYQETKG